LVQASHVLHQVVACGSMKGHAVRLQPYSTMLHASMTETIRHKPPRFIPSHQGLYLIVLSHHMHFMEVHTPSLWQVTMQDVACCWLRCCSRICMHPTILTGGPLLLKGMQYKYSGCTSRSTASSHQQLPIDCMMLHKHQDELATPTYRTELPIVWSHAR
jgi:hypothetical protein